MNLRRREFIQAIIASSAAWPLAARAEEPERMRRVGVLMNLPADDPEAQRRVQGLVAALRKFGWVEGKNIQIDYRWSATMRATNADAAELVGLPLDVIVANGPPSAIALQQVTHSMPVVFVAVTDPVALGIVQNLSHPSGNLTGFSPAESDLSGKWIELLKEIAPQVRRVAVFRDPNNPGGQTQVALIEGAASALGIEVSFIAVKDPETIANGVAAFAAAPNGGLIVLRTTEDISARSQIIALAAQYRLPAVYPLRFFASEGGLIAYGPDIVDEFRLAAGYVDRILKGEKPGDLPVQTPTKYELVINLKTAKTLGLIVPPSMQLLADEVIE
jgi:putative tryptophan/tyrosine transport system substrate-binding protein